MVLFQSVTPALPLSFNLVDVDLFETAGAGCLRGLLFLHDVF